MGNNSSATSGSARESSHAFVEKQFDSMKPGDKESKIQLGIRQLQQLESSILKQYPFLKDAKEASCLADLRLRDQPLIYANDGFLEMTMYPREEIIGRNCRFLQGRYSNRETVRAIREAITAGEPRDVEIINYRKDGLPYWSNFLLLPVWETKADRNGGPTHYIAVQKDVTLIRPHLTSMMVLLYRLLVAIVCIEIWD